MESTDLILQQLNWHVQVISNLYVQREFSYKYWMGNFSSYQDVGPMYLQKDKKENKLYPIECEFE